MRVLSLGAGVQSSTLLLMACEGTEPIDAAIFADTQWEPHAVYAHLSWLEQQARTAGIPVYRVTGGNLREDALAVGRRAASLPFYLVNPDGSDGMLRRQCTGEYKIKQIKSQIRALGATAEQPARQLIGISLDECHRMRDSDVRYIRHEYPLIDRGMTRHDCLRWMERHGYPRPPKSACIGCPFHDNAHWRRLRDESPDEWQDAVAFDRAIRHNARTAISGTAYLHRQRVPLDEADIRSAAERGQLDLFGEECAGVCGI